MQTPKTDPGSNKKSNKSITHTSAKLVVKQFPTKKNPDQDDLLLILLNV